MIVEIKPCPFCGGKANHNDGGDSCYGRFWWSVWCNDCQVEMRDIEAWDDDPKRPGMLHPRYPAGECIDRWNRRTG